MHTIVIVGGGFAGINLALHLANNSGFQVVLVDKNNYNHFTPLLYQVATGMLDVSSITIPFRTLFKKKTNLHFRYGELLRIDTIKKQLILDNGKLTYHQLVIAIGSKSNFFGNLNIERNSLPMKSIDQAVELRNTLLNIAEMASLADENRDLEALQNIVIAGGGPAGVEIAGMLAELRANALPKLYPELDNKGLNIYLVEGSENLLSGMRKASSAYAMQCMADMNVITLLNIKVDDYVDNIVSLSNGQTIISRTLIWTTGVTVEKVKGLEKANYGTGNRLIVSEYNEVFGYPDVFAIGDACLQMNNPDFPEGYPQLGSVASQQGKQLGKNLVRMRKGKTLRPFNYLDKGTMAIIGKSRATADMEFPKRTLKGWMAWAAWLFVHLALLITYRNKVKTMWEWTVSYLTTTEPDGLMIGKSKLSARKKT